MSAKNKKVKRRVVIILTDTVDDKFKIDLVHEPSIKGREEQARAFSPSFRVGQEICRHVLSKYDKKFVSIE